MRSVVKYNSGSMTTLPRLEKIGTYLSEHRGRKGRDGIAAVAVAFGDTTDDVAHSLYLRKAANGPNSFRADPEYLFRRYGNLVSDLHDEHLNKFMDAIYRSCSPYFSGEADHLQQWLLALPDRAAAYVLHAYLRQAGIQSTLADVTDTLFPVILPKRGTADEVDLEESRKIAAAYALHLKNGILVVPGGVGVYGREVRTLGRGGGDTTAATLGYTLGAEDVTFVSRSPLTAAPRRFVDDAPPVDEIDLKEAEVAGAFGAGLQTDRAVEPLGAFFAANPHGRVRITDDDMNHATRINPDATPVTVRFIVSTDIERYGMRGNVGAVFARLCDTPADWFDLGGRSRYQNIGVSLRGRELVRDVLEAAVRAGEIMVAYSGNEDAYIAAAGSGMLGGMDIERRAKAALTDVDIFKTPDASSIGRKSGVIEVVVDKADEPKVVQAWYRELIEKPAA
ncbi:MAG: hypothetical protein HYY37_05035 [Candidatus Aenigmarchaeota archaeon]|nr:hypothetical protein [Candidatus Aenigmarchaeota archaeon]